MKTWSAISRGQQHDLLPLPSPGSSRHSSTPVDKLHIQVIKLVSTIWDRPHPSQLYTKNARLLLYATSTRVASSVARTCLQARSRQTKPALSLRLVRHDLIVPRYTDTWPHAQTDDPGTNDRETDSTNRRQYGREIMKHTVGIGGRNNKWLIRR